MKCPYCKETIDDDSRFCDQCGKELHFCPECRQPKRGTECPACGADLVDGEHFFDQPIESDHVGATNETPTASFGIEWDRKTPTTLEGDGYCLPIKEGVFGRTTGIYPEFSSNIYISGRHGELRCLNGQWQIRDLGSHNGTWLNGLKLLSDMWVSIIVGDRLKIATIHLTVK